MDFNNLVQASIVVMTAAITTLTGFFSYFIYRGRKRSELADQIVELVREQREGKKITVSTGTIDITKGQDFRSFFSNIERLESALRKNEYLFEQQFRMLQQVYEQQQKFEQTLTKSGVAPALPSAGLEVEDKIRYISS